MNIDLHCHSYFSDGKLSPQELLSEAHKNGATILALTDHDHIGGLEQARDNAVQYGINFINGVEISVTWRGRTIHIVGLNFKPSSEFVEILEKNRNGRIERLQKISDKLQKKSGFSGVYEGALALSNQADNVSRMHIAQFLINQGYVKNREEAFRKWLGDNKSCNCRIDWINLADAVSLICTHGGVAVIAHPARYKLSATALRNLIEEFINAGGIGIEVASSLHSLNERLNIALVAERYNLYASAGSDFHGYNDFNRTLGKTYELPPICRPIWDLF